MPELIPVFVPSPVATPDPAVLSSNFPLEKVMRFLFILLIILSSAIQGPSKDMSADWFVLNPQKPYVYLEFDHTGKREPALNGESEHGLWLRFVNNCRVPVTIRTFDLGTKDPGIGLMHDVVQKSRLIDIPISENEVGLKAQIKAPIGYSFETATRAAINPGERILFSVPLEHVSPDWYIRVEFHMDLPSSNVTPYSYVDFYWSMLPSKARSSK